MGFCGYTVLPVVAGLLLTTCAHKDYNSHLGSMDPPCLELKLSQNHLGIIASNSDTTCTETTFERNNQGTFDITTLEYEHKPSKDKIESIEIKLDDSSYIQNEYPDNYTIITNLPLKLDPGFHTLEVIACNASDYCTSRTMPVFSYGLDIKPGHLVINNNNPPEIETELVKGSGITFCRNCIASNDSGITRIEISQGDKKLSQEFERYKNTVNFSKLIKESDLKSNKPFEITVYSPTTSTTKIIPHESYNGFRAMGEGP